MGRVGRPAPRRRRAASEARLFALSLFVAGMISPSPAAADGRKYALLIGLDDYGPGGVEGITRLGYARNDVAELQKALTALGFEFPERPLVNEVARRLDIVRALAYFADRVTDNDTFVLFFAGHGVRARNGHTYWLTRDTSLGLLDENGIRLEHLMDYVRDIKGKKLVLLDHCFSGDVTSAVERSRSLESNAVSPAPPRSGEGGVTLTRGVRRVQEVGDEILTRGSGLIVLAAARDEAFESDRLRHGVFTYALLDALRSRRASHDASLGILDLVQFLGPKVKELSQTLSLPDQGVHPVFPAGAFADWEIGRPPSGNTEDYLSNLRRWADRTWITVSTKMRCKEVIEKSARARAGGPALTPAESELLQVIVGHMHFQEGQEEAWAKELQETLNPEP